MLAFIRISMIFRRLQSRQLVDKRNTLKQGKDSLKNRENVLSITHKVDEVSDSKELVNNIRILCWIMTSPKSHWKAKVVRDTWGKRCNILVFISSEEGKLRSMSEFHLIEFGCDGLLYLYFVAMKLV